MMQPVHHLLLCGKVRFGLRYLRRQPARIQPRQQLAFLDVIALLRQNGGDALAAIEWQLDLPQIYIAVESQLGRARTACERPPQSRSDNEDDDDDQNGESARFLTCDSLIAGR